MRVGTRDVEFFLGFTNEEKAILAPSFMFGDAEDQLSYAVSQFGSERVTNLIIGSGNTDIAYLALAEVDELSETCKHRLEQMLEARNQQ